MLRVTLGRSVAAEVSSVCIASSQARSMALSFKGHDTYLTLNNKSIDILSFDFDDIRHFDILLTVVSVAMSLQLDHV